MSKEVAEAELKALSYISPICALAGRQEAPQRPLRAQKPVGQSYGRLAGHQGL
jgi:hypothetical protein